MEQELTQKLINAVENIGADVKTLATKVGSLETKFDRLETKVDHLENRFDHLEKKVDKLEDKFDALESKVDRIDTTVNKLVVKVVEMDGRMDTFATKGEYDAKFDEVITMIDGFVNKQTTLDHELVSMRNKNERTDERLTVVEHHLGLAA